jgi:uncharacterized membrane protein YgdD (TMEM256/DUF423 family)
MSLSMQKRLLQFSGFSGAIAVSLGALGAHGLKEKMKGGLLSLDSLQAFDTATRYQMYHSIALLLMALLLDKFDSRLITRAAYCMMIGIVLFSGSLYILSTAGLFGLEHVAWLGPITPIGGLFFIFGWIFLAVAGIKKA